MSILDPKIDDRSVIKVTHILKILEFIVKGFAKFLARSAFLILALPIYISYALFCLIGKKDSIFQAFSQMLSLIPGKIGSYLRASFYHLACEETSLNISVGFLTVLSHWDTTIGEGVYIGPQCNVGKCKIAPNTLIGSGVHILSGKRQHSFSNIDIPVKEQGGHFEKISIGTDCWIGNSAVILANISDHCIIAAGSVFTKDCSNSGDIFAGNPARLIRNRNSKNETNENTND